MLGLETPTGQAVLACAVDFAGRAPAPRSLIARAPRRLSRATAEFWAERWHGCLAPPLDAELRAERLGRDVRRWRALQGDVDAVEAQVAELLAKTPGQILTTLPGVAGARAAAFCVHALPIERFPTAERLRRADAMCPDAGSNSKRSLHECWVRVQVGLPRWLWMLPATGCGASRRSAAPPSRQLDH